MPPIRSILVACSIASCVVGPAFAAPVVVHRVGPTYEDGIPGLDPDAVSSCASGICSGGTRDGQTCSEDKDCPDVKDDKLRWEAGVVHVASDNYTVTGPFDSGTNAYRPFELTIESGATVKVASTCTLDSGDEIVSCQPTTFGAGQIYVSNGSVLKVEGATITDIRDDTEGGDTNNDGSATTPSPSYVVRFGGSPEESLVDSTIKYAALVGHFGSMPVEGNTFVQSGGAGDYQGSSIYNTHPPVRGAMPSIVDNSFEIVSGTQGPGALDVRGQSAIVWGNDFTGNAGSVVIGPTWENLFEYKNALPEDGVTVVAHNHIAAKEGIAIAPATATVDNILQQVRFRADIHDNRLVGPSPVGNVGLGLAMFTDTTVRANTVENYSNPFQLRMTGVVLPPSAQTAALIGLELHGNSFSLAGAQTGPVQFYEAFWKDFATTVDAENNWWGHSTGPKDASNTDGLANPRGLGLPVSNGIDYAPFLPGAATESLDSIRLAASAFPPPPLVPDTGDVVFNVAISDYTLASASTGTVTIHVRNSQGEDLVTPVSKAVSSSGHQVGFDPITLPAVPRFTSAVVVEAVLMPDNSSGDEVRSKPKSFPVARPKGEFALFCADDTDVGGNCDPPKLLPGNTSNLALRFGYRFKGTVHGHVRLEERSLFGGELLHAFPTIDFIAPSAEFGSTFNVFTTYERALTDAAAPLASLTVRYWAEDDGGVEIASRTTKLAISYGNNFSMDVATLDAMLNKRDDFPNGHMLVGEHPKIELGIRYVISTTNVTNWMLRVTSIDARDVHRSVLHTYDPGPLVIRNNLTTGSGAVTGHVIAFDDEPVLPPGTAELAFDVELYAPDESVAMERAFVSIPVRDPEDVVVKAIPSGASTTSFSPVPVELKATANPAAGNLAIEEFLDALTSGRPAPDSQSGGEGVMSKASAATAVETRLIPLNRHYSLYDTLSDTGLNATVTLGYNPSTDFPDDAGFDEDSLVVAVRNPLSGALEALPSTHDKAQHKVTAAYDSFFGLWTVASQTTAPAAACADPTADGKTTAGDALFALRASVGSSQCEKCICDVNKNGTVSSTDALLILKVAVGQLAAPTCVACA